MELIPISTLDVQPALPEDKAIRGIITLIWPYSSSTRSAAILLAEPDFRLRRLKGQVRIQLTGAAAEAIALSKAGSGDVVLLNLQGARWLEATPGLGTPGKSVDIELAFNHRLTCEISRSGQLIHHIDVEDKTPSEPRKSPVSLTTSATHSRVPAVPYPLRDLGLSTPASSAFHRRARVVSGELVDSPYDPFAKDDINTAHTRKKQRLSWGGEGRWTVDKKLPSPLKISAADTAEGYTDDLPLEGSKGTGEHTELPTLNLEQGREKTRRRRSLIATDQTHEVQEHGIRVSFESTREDIREESGSKLLSDEDERHQESAEEDANTMQTAFGSDMVFKSKFAVFRDESFLQRDSSSLGPQRIMSAEPLDQLNVKIRQEEHRFFDLPSSDPAEPGEDVAEAMSPIRSKGPAVVEHDSDQPCTEITSPRMLPSELTPLRMSAFSALRTYQVGQSSPQPASPRTPIIRTQHSAVLQLPSPFTGEELLSYVNYSPEVGQGTFSTFNDTRSPVLPDYMLQLGFGFGSQGFARGGQSLTESTAPAASSMTAPLESSMDPNPGDMLSAEIDPELMFLAMPQQSSRDRALSHCDTEERDLNVDDSTSPTQVPQLADLQPSFGKKQRTLSPSVISLSSDQLKSSDVEEDPNTQHELKALLEERGSMSPKSGSDSEGELSDRYENSAEIEWQVESDVNESQSDIDESQSEESGTDDDRYPVRDTHIPSLDGSGESRPKAERSSSIVDPSALSTTVLSQSSSLDIMPGALELVDQLDDGDLEQQARLAIERLSSKASGIEHSEQKKIASTPTSGQSRDPAWHDDFRADEPISSPQDPSPVLPGITAASTVYHVQSLKQPSTTKSPPRFTASSSQAGLAQKYSQTEQVQAERVITPDQRSVDEAIDRTDPVLASSSLTLQDQQVSYPQLHPVDHNVTTSLEQHHSDESIQASYNSAVPDVHNKIGESLSHFPTQLGENSQAIEPGQNESKQSVLDWHEFCPLTIPKLERSTPDVEMEEASQHLHDVIESRSDDASSFLSPWFNRRISQGFDFHESDKMDIQNFAADKSQTLLHDDNSQLFTHVSETQLPLPDSASPLIDPDIPDTAVETSLSSTQPSLEHVSERSATELSFSQSQSQALQARGLLTTLSYYTPITNLYSHIRGASSSQGSMGSGVDIIAVVSKATTKPLRAEKGQRDWHTTFSITDSYFWPRSIRVQTFRPWRAALPRAEEGDVVLLRTFEVFSAKGNIGIGLKSGEDAAWCVWHFAETPKPNALSSSDGSSSHVDIAVAKPWTKRERRSSLTLPEREEMKGPPVEVGDEERDFVGNIRNWWVGEKRLQDEEQMTELGSDQLGESSIEVAA